MRGVAPTVAAGLLLATLAATGCVRYVPVQPAAVPPGEEVRVRFTDEGAVRLVRELGRITPQLVANIEAQSADSLMLSVWIGREYRGTPFEEVRQTVAVQRGEVAEVSRRQVSVSRSVLAGVGVAIAFGFLVQRLTQDDDPNPPTNGTDLPPPEPSGVRGTTSVLRFAIPFPFGGAR